MDLGFGYFGDWFGIVGIFYFLNLSFGFFGFLRFIFEFFGFLLDSWDFFGIPDLQIPVGFWRPSGSLWDFLDFLFFRGGDFPEKYTGVLRVIHPLVLYLSLIGHSSNSFIL